MTLGLSSGGILSSQGAQELPRFASPPLREDDKDGHYVFAVGDNLTSRCKYLARIWFVYLQLSNSIYNHAMFHIIFLTFQLQKFH